jgi:predicted RNA-binding Zn-ribbon protein involved in translation (DUF1610 family)
MATEKGRAATCGNCGRHLTKLDKQVAITFGGPWVCRACGWRAVR